MEERKWQFYKGTENPKDIIVTGEESKSAFMSMMGWSESDWNIYMKEIT